jgi:hypothetical protein
MIVMKEQKGFGVSIKRLILRKLRLIGVLKIKCV